MVTMAETFSIERRKLMRYLGAKVILTPAAARAVGMVAKTIELAEAHGWFYTRQFENEANADFHSRTTAKALPTLWNASNSRFTAPRTCSSESSAIVPSGWST